nr:2-isopropylmalate synthase [Maliibacterium massiliense]
MKRMIAIADTTLRDGEQAPGMNLNPEEKLQIARQLERLGVDAIEAGFPIASPGDFEAVRAIARAVRTCTVAGLCRATRADIDRAWDALREAAKPRLHIFIATSALHMQQKLNMTPQEVLSAIDASIAYARTLCDDVEFSCEDATRSEEAFLIEALTCARRAGATVLNIADTVGYITPGEMYNLVSTLREQVPGAKDVPFGVHCHNDLGLAVANTLAGIEAGATHAEVTVGGMGERAGNAPLEQVVMALYTRAQYYGCATGIVTQQLYRTAKLVASVCGLRIPHNKPVVGKNVFLHESGIHQHAMLHNRSTYEIISPESVGAGHSGMVLGKHSGRHAVEERLRDLGYVLTPEKLDELFEKFKTLADKKRHITDQDLEALASGDASTIPDVYKLAYFHIVSGNALLATATVQLEREGESLQEAATGDGPVDAVFRALERAAGMEVELNDYFLRAVTGGKDALGEVTVKVTDERGHNVVGKGISTDIIEASARALVNAFNKLIYERAMLAQASARS